MVRHTRSEYLVLRRTIAQRGALRPILLVCGTGIWAATLTAVLVWLPYPVAAAIPLVMIAATFEAIRPLHFGAERIGRYLQVFYEEAGDPGRALGDTPSWERVAMAFGKVPGVGGHPLFMPIFFLATIVNYLAVMIPGPVPMEMAVMAIPHVAMIGWLLAAHRAMKSQREIELERLRTLAK
jgi:hypothetical protein